MSSLESALSFVLSALDKHLRVIVEDAVKRAVTQALTDVLEKREDRFEWISNTDAMRLLNKGRSTLARYRASGALSFSKLGGDVYYRRADIEALLERGLVEENETPTT